MSNRGDWSPDQLYVEVTRRIADKLEAAVVIYDVCDSWHSAGRFERTDAFIELILTHDSAWLDSNLVGLSLLSITSPAVSKLKNRRALYSRMHSTYMENRPSECVDLLTGYEGE